jgi:hypothetical protein
MALTLSVSDEFMLSQKVKNSLSTPLKAYRESRGVAPLNHNLGTGWRLVVNLMLWPLYPEGTSRCLLHSCWMSTRAGLKASEKNRALNPRSTSP